MHSSEDSIAIGMTTAPRVPSTLEWTLTSLRAAGFRQEIHIFAEPGVPTPEDIGTRTHHHRQRQGCLKNWIFAANWLLRFTDAENVVLCEDDVEYRQGAASALRDGLTRLDRVGLVSLYTAVHNGKVARVTEGTDGWVPLVLGRKAWGSLFYGFRRPVLEQLIKLVDHQLEKGTDWHITSCMESLGLNCWYHLPSFARHIGFTSTVGHKVHAESAAVGWR